MSIPRIQSSSRLWTPCKAVYTHKINVSTKTVDTTAFDVWPSRGTEKLEVLLNDGVLWYRISNATTRNVDYGGWSMGMVVKIQLS